MPMAQWWRGLARIRRRLEQVVGLGADHAAELPRAQVQALFRRHPGARRDLVNLSGIEQHLAVSPSADGLDALVIELALEELDIARADGRATEVGALRRWLVSLFSAQADSRLTSTQWAATSFTDDLAGPPARPAKQRR